MHLRLQRLCPITVVRMGPGGCFDSGYMATFHSRRQRHSDPLCRPWTFCHRDPSKSTCAALPASRPRPFGARCSLPICVRMHASFEPLAVCKQRPKFARRHSLRSLLCLRCHPLTSNKHQTIHLPPVCFILFLSGHTRLRFLGAVSHQVG